MRLESSRGKKRKLLKPLRTRGAQRQESGLEAQPRWNGRTEAGAIERLARAGWRPGARGGVAA